MQDSSGMRNRRFPRAPEAACAGKSAGCHVHPGQRLEHADFTASPAAAAGRLQGDLYAA